MDLLLTSRSRASVGGVGEVAGLERLMNAQHPLERRDGSGAERVRRTGLGQATG